MAYESPEAIKIKRYLEAHPVVQKTLLGNSGPFCLFQFDPVLRYIEENDSNELLFTARTGIPLCRYNLKDTGAVRSRADMLSAAPHEVNGWKPWKLPYVALFGRSDYALVFYGPNIYPDHIRAALSHRKFLGKLTGKFTMEKNYTSSMDQKLIIHVELRDDVKGNTALQHELSQTIVTTLLRLNMEYADASARLGKDLVPKVALHRYRDTHFFAPSLKPRYIT